MGSVATTSLGIPLLDQLLPRGVRRNSLVVIAGDGGTGKSYIASRVAAAFLERGEPVVYIAFDDDPGTLVEALEAEGVDVDEAIGSRRLTVVDAYGPRYGVEFASYAYELALTDLTSLYSMLSRIVSQRIEPDSGLLVIDSLNPLLVKFEPSLFIDFVNMVRAGIAKKRKTLVLATLHTPTQLHMEIAANLECVADVFIWLRYHQQALEAGYTVKEVLVKKAKGVPVSAGWTPFTITDEGVVAVRIRTVKKGEDGD